MSVLECSRNGCDHIMCDRHSSTYGYICDNCFNELVSLGPRVDIAEFMNSPASNEFERDAAEAYFNAIFKDRSEWD